VTVPTVLDTTLRDGSHAVEHQFTLAQVRDVTRALDAAGVEIIEVSHGDGLGGASLQCGFSATPELQLVSEAASVVTQARIAVMVLPGIGGAYDLEQAASCGAQVARVATLCTEADLAQRHLRIAIDLDLEPIGFLMLSHLPSPRFLADQAERMESYGARCVYLADSAGAMLPDDVRARVAALKNRLTAEVGFHAHNNLGLAMGNCLAALDAGADWLDGSLRGLGAGAGNAATEVIATVLDRMGRAEGLNPFRLMDAAEFTVAPFMPYQPIPDRDSITVGHVGVYSTFLQHAREAGARYGVDPRDILVELGARGALVGQEDMAADIAVTLRESVAR
jgi:4-hydroxy 2-oxovalerate aldolase